MKRNIDRLKKIGADAAEGGKMLQSCFDWVSYPRSIAAFAVCTLLFSLNARLRMSCSNLDIYLYALSIIHSPGCRYGLENVAVNHFYFLFIHFIIDKE